MKTSSRASTAPNKPAGATHLKPEPEKASAKPTPTPRTRKPVDISSIKFMDDIPVPPNVKKSKYPWEELGKAESGKKSFFIECASRKEAEDLKPSLQASGKKYYASRKINRVAVTRVYELPSDTEGGLPKIGVAAWSVEPEAE